MGDQAKDKPDENAVHKNAILVESIKKEMAVYKPYETFAINPYNKLHVLAGKPNSKYDQLDPSAANFDFFDQIKRANQEPNKKYDEAQTVNQEYGWINKPLVELEKEDKRLYFGRANSEITKYMEVYFLQKEQETMHDKN
ncbi:cilia- and flagella-associated protein 144-like [Convolutriloba macropyga]|uniref:cilia- and flagella-associated protein 144-like n=1 Tax=Convolutriloba macropyga TaxID=536237 RepID=UPI003F51B5D8